LSAARQDAAREIANAALTTPGNGAIARVRASRQDQRTAQAGMDRPPSRASKDCPRDVTGLCYTRAARLQTGGISDGQEVKEQETQEEHEEVEGDGQKKIPGGKRQFDVKAPLQARNVPRVARSPSEEKGEETKTPGGKDKIAVKTPRPAT
jgi:hypothetical protein